jgi:hypothetical protein
MNKSIKVKSYERKSLKAGDKIRIHKHSGIYISGRIVSVNKNYISYRADDNSVMGSINIRRKDIDDFISFK